MPNKLQMLLQLVKAKKGAYGAQRVERAADEIKNLEKLYSQEALSGAFLGDNAKALMSMPTKNFERYAVPLKQSSDLKLEFVEGLPEMTRDEYIKYLSKVKGLADVPYLEIGSQAAGKTPYIAGHEGRHRMRALNQAGQESGLVVLQPRYELREPLPRRSQEEYINALRQEIGAKPVVSPELAKSASPEVRSDIELPEIYKQGGKVSQDAMHMAVMNQKVQKKAGGAVHMKDGDLVDELISEAKKKQEAPFDQFSPKPKLKSGQSSEVQKTIEQVRAEVEANRRAADVLKQNIQGITPREGSDKPYAGRSTIFPEGIMRDVAESTYRDLGPSIVPAESQWEPSVTIGRKPSYVSPVNVGSVLGEAGAALDFPFQLAGEETFRATGSPMLATAAAYGPGMIGPEKYIKGSKALANEAAYRIHQAMTKGEGPLAGALAGVTPRNIVSPNIAEKLSTKRALPENDLFKQAIENTAGAKITDQGIIIPLERRQVQEQIGMPSVRGGVFYLPKGSEQMRHYTGRGGYGGQEKISGETLVTNPLFVKGATGGKAPEAAYDQLMGKGAYQKMRNDALHWGGGPQDIREEAVTKFLENYAPDMTDQAFYILQNSKRGNQLAYALQEAAVASAARNAGHDAILGYGVSRKTKQPFISEVFDVREINYPEKGVEAEVWPQYKAEGGLTSDDLIVEETPL
jgi:hypothetical protein